MEEIVKATILVNSKEEAQRVAAKLGGEVGTTNLPGCVWGVAINWSEQEGWLPPRKI